MSLPARHYSFWSLFASAIPDLQPIEELLPPTFWERHRATLLLGGLLAAAISVAVVWWLWRPRAVMALPPADIARAAFQELESGPDNRFSAGLVLKTLRRYLAASISAWPRGELTVEEMIPQLHRETSMPPELKVEIALLLRQCEQCHFSSGRLNNPAKLAARARELVSKIETAKIAAASHPTMPA